MQFFKQWSNAKIIDRFSHEMFTKCCFNHDISKMKSNLFKVVIKHQISLTCSLNRNLIWIMRMIFKINLLFVNWNLMNLIKIMILSLCCLTKLTFTNSRVEVSISIIIDALREFVNVFIFSWKSNCRSLLALRLRASRMNDDNLIVLKCESIICSNCLIRLRISLRSFRTRFCSKIFNFSARHQQITRFLSSTIDFLRSLLRLILLRIELIR